MITSEELARIRAAAIGDMLGDSGALDELGPSAVVFRLCWELNRCIERWNALPSALEWTDEPPKVPGWYWFKDEYGIRIAWIKHDSRKMNELYAVIGGVGNWMSTLHGQWAGPITEPQEPKGE